MGSGAQCFCAMYLCMCSRVYPEMLLTQKYVTDFHQTDTSDVLGDKDERFAFWVHKVNGQDHVE